MTGRTTMTRNRDQELYAFSFIYGAAMSSYLTWLIFLILIKAHVPLWSHVALFLIIPMAALWFTAGRTNKEWLTFLSGYGLGFLGGAVLAALWADTPDPFWNHLSMVATLLLAGIWFFFWVFRVGRDRKDNETLAPERHPRSSAMQSSITGLP